MADHKKKIVSLRVNSSGLSKVKEIEKRLGVRESEVLRFSIKSTLGRLAPLHDPAYTGSDLIPVFSEFGPEIANYFQLDASQLEMVINSDADASDTKID